MRTTRLAVGLLAALSLAACASNTDNTASTQAGATPVGGTVSADLPSNGVAPEALETIVDVVIGNEDFTTLAAALQAAGLDATLSGTGPFTLFAPTDEAFDAALSELDMTLDELLSDTSMLTTMLTYHVINEELLSSDVAKLDGQQLTTLEGSPIEISSVGDSVMVNDANLTATDVTASNGVVQVIDKVLVPPLDSEQNNDGAELDATDDNAEGNLMMVAATNSDISTFVEATGPSDLFETLAVGGTFTLFVPTNEAFAAVLDRLGLTKEELFADQQLLTAILTYHALDGRVSAAQVAELDGEEIASVQGGPLAISTSSGTVMVNDATVIASDIAATNGVIHIIDKVLLPPAN